MTNKNIKKVISEEVQKMLEASISRRFQKAVETLQSGMLKQQQLGKKFMAEKNPDKKEKIKQALIAIRKVIKKAELDYEGALYNEPAGELEETDIRKVHGDKRLENPKTGNKVKLRTALKAKKGSKVYSTAKKIYNKLKDQE